MVKGRPIIATLCAVALVAACASTTSPTAQSTDPAKAAEIMRIINAYMKEAHLKSVIVKVSADGKDIVTAAVGESMTGVPATVDMHFRNGAVAISYVSTLSVEGCGTCVPLNDFRTYGLGVWISGNWIFQNPLFYGYAAVDAYLPSKKIAIAVAVTYEPEAFNSKGAYVNGGDALFRKIGALLAPDDASPVATSESDKQHG